MTTMPLTCCEPLLPVVTAEVVVDELPEDVSTRGQCDAVQQEGHALRRDVGMFCLEQLPQTATTTQRPELNILMPNANKHGI